ncbi:Ups1p NDAI_0E04410 [Naumovozyma dairenensis CBS 421]|uniref:PRELI/MSF1 domain-containing protein n=1 Tax=Naumovozyma dairenensis (strain ATCC 10597 / BCRC 20456 / CBS 421 / NBRC 0211 / NRRL Y-12639) TaxID=1071378 RepID=G0WBY8_NAUDC|nr:hypothetical protein NDAI_0E04410 [Naumovozyma dairenensis CBS 421]CCD25258.1 hypothetical protein NDAI_0E04410 [Naumovozyma dairenensis CBS 421]
MVLVHKNTHIFQHDFRSVSCAFFNRYPNPYSSHVLSIDTLSRRVDTQDGKLYTTRLLKKQGKLPSWTSSLIGRVSDSWIIEYSVIDPKLQKMETYTKNLDHIKILKVEEYTTYYYDSKNRNTVVTSEVKFSSGFHLGIKNKIENWSRSKFDESVKKSRMGMSFVMQKWEEQKSIKLDEETSTI